MDRHIPHRYCSYCSKQSSKFAWFFNILITLNIVFRNREDGTIILTPQTYIPYPYRSFGAINCTFGTPPAPLREIRIRFQLCRLKMQSRGAHLIHPVCLETLQNLLGQNISSEKLFMVCRSLEQEWGKEELDDLELCHRRIFVQYSCFSAYYFDSFFRSYQTSY